MWAGLDWHSIQLLMFTGKWSVSIGWFFEANCTLLPWQLLAFVTKEFPAVC